MPLLRRMYLMVFGDASCLDVKLDPTCLGVVCGLLIREAPKFDAVHNQLCIWIAHSETLTSCVCVEEPRTPLYMGDTNKKVI